MAQYDASTYGEQIADVYDRWPGVPANAAAVAEFLAPLAKGRRALELGIGTGRVALPLAARAVKVCGIDASPAMVAKLRQKPGGAAIPVEIGNFADVRIGGRFSVVYVVFNTFFAVLTQDEQVQCFARVAKRLAPDGVFVIEAFIPDLSRFDRGQRTSTLLLDDDRAIIDAATIDYANQVVRSQHILISDDGIRRYPVVLRFAYPSELDLMARLAGMRLRERFGGWDRTPFTSSSPSHVSVYELSLTGRKSEAPKRHGGLGRRRR
jgi:SAM-dependent methyltransferase